MDKSQIAIEFIIVYSLVLLIFLIVFALVANERAYTLDQQEYSQMQLVTEAIAEHMDIALEAGNGYVYSLTLPTTDTLLPYNLEITPDGAVKATMRIGSDNITSISYSAARDIHLNNSGLGYTVPTYSGQIEFYNDRGDLYIDSYPNQNPYIAKYLYTSTKGYNKVASFNGRNSYIYIPNISNPTGDNLSYSVWFYLNKIPGNNAGIIYANNSTQSYYDTPLSLFPNGNCNLQVYLHNSSDATFSDDSGLCLESYKWYQATVFVNQSSHQYGLYIDGNLSFTDTFKGELSKADGFYIGLFYPQGAYFPGYISDVQIYTSALNKSEAEYLYNSGMNAKPLNNANLLAWYPLDGNIEGYGESAINATSKNLNFSNNFLVSTNVTNLNNSQLNNDLVGFVSSVGNLSSPYRYDTVFSSNTLNNYQSVIWNSSINNLTINAFNGNLYSQNYLDLWYPLDSGSGNVIFDLTGHGNTGYMSANAIWRNDTEYTKVYSPKFNSTLNDYIEMNVSNNLLDIARNQSFSFDGWVNYTKGNHIETIISDTNSTYDSGFNIYINSSGDLNAIIDGYNLNESQPIPSNVWQFISVNYNENNGTMYIYLNGILEKNNSLRGLSLVQYAPYYIGNNYTLSTNSELNGSVSNVQLYASELSKNKILSLYKEGVTGLPLNQSKIIAWLPLDGNSSDYGYPSKTISKGIIYNESSYIHYVSSRPTLYFNGSNNNQEGNQVFIKFLSEYNKINPAGDFTASVWFKTESNGTILWNGGDITSSNTPECGDNYSPILYVNDAGDLAGGDWTGSQPFNTSEFVANGNWNFVSIVQNKSNSTQVLYLNGEKIDTATGTAQSISPFYWIIGNGATCKWADSPRKANDYFNGSIADVQLYNTTLNSTEIEDLYTSGLPIYERYSLLK